MSVSIIIANGDGKQKTSTVIEKRGKDNKLCAKQPIDRNTCATDGHCYKRSVVLGMKPRQSYIHSHSRSIYSVWSWQTDLLRRILLLHSLLLTAFCSRLNSSSIPLHPPRPMKCLVEISGTSGVAATNEKVKRRISAQLEVCLVLYVR